MRFLVLWTSKNKELSIKRIYKFTAKKFGAQPPARQLRVLAEMLLQLENADTEAEFCSLWEHLCELFGWLPEELALHFAGAKELDCHDRERILRFAQTYLIRSGKDFSDLQIHLHQGDFQRSGDPRLLERAAGFVVILDNLRSAFNIGSIFRTAECLAVQELALCGICALPGHPKLEQTAMGTQSKVSWRYFQHSLEAVQYYREQGYEIVALETAEQALNVFEADFQFPLALVLGNESLGISSEVLAEVDYLVQLPVLGWKNSLNVGVSFAVAAYRIICGS